MYASLAWSLHGPTTFSDDQLKIGGNHLLYEVQMFSKTPALLESEGNCEWGCGPLA
jgi:hypothetical protein